jgi:hypothetical protein
VRVLTISECQLLRVSTLDGASSPSLEADGRYKCIGSNESPRIGRSSSHGTLDTRTTERGIPA